MNIHRAPFAQLASYSLLVLLFATGSLFADAPPAPEIPAASPGLVKDQPASGRFVKTDQGFMVPYKAVIPGTDVEFEMEPIPGGTFLMGSPADDAKRKPDEGPQVQITVAPFWMGKYEVTWAEYKKYMALSEAFRRFRDANIRQPSAENVDQQISAPSKLYDPGFTFGVGGKPRQPAITMSQFAARQYTKWLSGMSGDFYRLPSEAEWEYASRAGTTTPYFFGSDPKQLGEYAWYFENAEEVTHEVGQKKPNPWGLYDIYGNVGEWTLDAYSTDGYKSLAGRTQPMSADETIAWPKELYPRVLRGGTYDDDADRLRSAARLASNDKDWRAEDPNTPKSPWWFTEKASIGVGFRLVRSLVRPAKSEYARYWDADVDSVRDHVKQRVEKEGKGGLGVVDPSLPKAIEELKK